MFDALDLITILTRLEKQEAALPLMKLSGPTASNWSITAQWQSDPGSEDTLLLSGHLKADDTSDTQHGQVKIHLNRQTKTIKNCEVIQVSNAVTDNHLPLCIDETRLEELKKNIPPPQRTGPVLDVSIESESISKHECEGDSAIRIEEGVESSVHIVQEYVSRNGSFLNFVNIDHIIVSKKQTILPEILTQKRSNPVEKPVSIARVNVKYQGKDGHWIDCREAKLFLTHNENKRATSILNIEPDKLIPVTVQAAIPVKGEPNRNDITRSRVHRSLPQPLKLKIIVTDNLSKTCSLMVEQINEPLGLITAEKFIQNEGSDLKRLIAFIHADDCQYDERISAGIYIDSKDRLITKVDARTVYMEKSHILRLQSKAKKAKKVEEPIDFVCNSQVQAFCLFDPETYFFYAIRLELTTSTSKTTETFLLPLDEIK